jgi:hypothetical protein
MNKTLYDNYVVVLHVQSQHKKKRETILFIYRDFGFAKQFNFDSNQARSIFLILLNHANNAFCVSIGSFPKTVKQNLLYVTLNPNKNLTII